jgi:hypothetical protein
MYSLADVEGVVLSMAENGEYLFDKAIKRAKKMRDIFRNHSKMMVFNSSE